MGNLCKKISILFKTYLTHCPVVALIYEKKIRLQFFDMFTIFVRQTTFHLEGCPKLMSLFVNPVWVKWHPLKQTKTKMGHHFWKLIFKVIQPCCLAKKDSFTPKVLKLHFVSVKHGSALVWYVAHLTFDIEAELCLTVTNCNFRTFRVKESFWANQQSCITLKVSLWKWCLFFVFVCFNGCHFT